MKDTVELLQWFEEKWDSDYFPYILFCLVFICVLYARTTLPELNFEFSYWLLLAFILGLVTFALWKYQHRLPKAPMGSIGFFVAITPEEGDSRSKTVKDFVISLKDILQQVNTSDKPFCVVELSKYHSKKITNDLEAKAYCEKCKGSFLVFGNSKIRKSKGKDYHAVKLKGLVTHSPISLENSSVLAGEMNSVLPLDFKVSCENDLVEFETISFCFSESAKFIIATAAMLSNDLNLALVLLKQLNESKKRLEKFKKDVPVMAKLLILIPMRLANLYDHLADMSFEAWRRNRDEHSLNLAKEYRESAHKLVPNPLRFVTTYAIWLFVIKKDVQGALKELRKYLVSYIQVPVLRYGMAFLYAYSGDMKKAFTEYEAAFNLDSSFQTAFEVEEFIAWVLSLEPDKYQLWYCLGLINYKIKNDKESAATELSKFIKCDVDNKFAETKTKAIQLLERISKEESLVVIN